MIYLVSLFAHRKVSDGTNDVSHQATIIASPSKKLVTKEEMRRFKQTNPPADGWSNHSIGVTEVSKTKLLHILLAQEKED